MNYDYGKDFDNNEMIFDKNYVENLNNEQNVYSDNLNDNSYLDEEWDKKEGNKFCVISLICHGASILISMFMGNISQGVIATMFGAVYWGLEIAACVLMIYVRVRYPKNTFGIILMIVYIVMIVLPFLFIAALIVLINAMCSGING